MRSRLGFAKLVIGKVRIFNSKKIFSSQGNFAYKLLLLKNSRKKLLC